MATVGPTITDAGIVVSDYPDILAQLQNALYSIFGSDLILDASSQDGQMLGVMARAIYDTQQAAVAAFNNFSPATSRGAGLSNAVKINGIRRHAASASQAVVTLGGVVGTGINGGAVGTSAPGTSRWLLPNTVIPPAGIIAVTATCADLGDIAAPAHSLTTILTPIRGWQTADNGAAAVRGAPVETDADLRRRQAGSTALSAQSVIDGIYGALANLPAVHRISIHENKTDAVDADGVPAHSIAVVVEGGDVQQICQTIALKKTPGTGTAGTSSATVFDSHGVPSLIRYYPLSGVPLKVQLSITPLAGYVSSTADAIKQALVDFIGTLDIGEDSYRTRLYTAANLAGTPLERTFFAVQIQQLRADDPTPFGPPGGGTTAGLVDIPIAFNEIATLDLLNITVVLV